VAAQGPEAGAEARVAPQAGRLELARSGQALLLLKRLGRETVRQELAWPGLGEAASLAPA